PDAVDASHVEAGAHVELGQFLRRNPARVLDHEPVHVHDPKATVRSGADLHRPKPRIGRRQELRLAFVVRAATHECRVLWAENPPRHTAINGLACERVAAKRLAEKLVPVNAEAAGSRGPARWTRQLEEFQTIRERKETIAVSFRNRDGGRRRTEKRIAAQKV